MGAVFLELSLALRESPNFSLSDILFGLLTITQLVGKDQGLIPTVSSITFYLGQLPPALCDADCSR